MKKLLLSFLFITTVLLAQAQDTKPTKEETITWLGEKMNKYAKDGGKPSATIEDIKITLTSCEIVVSYIPYTTYGTKGTKVVRIPINNLTIDTQGFSSSGESISSEFLAENGKIYYDNKFNWVVVGEVEGDLYARIKKAVDHLATFCPKKKETF